MAKVELARQETHRPLLARTIVRPHQRLGVPSLLERDLHLWRLRCEPSVSDGDGHSGLGGQECRE